MGWKSTRDNEAEGTGQLAFRSLLTRIRRFRFTDEMTAGSSGAGAGLAFAGQYFGEGLLLASA